MTRTGVWARAAIAASMLGAAVGVAAGAAPPAHASSVYYCYQHVIGYMNCPIHVNGYFNDNLSYVPHNHGFGNVCENATVYDRAGNISKRCSATASIDSFCDLYGYYNNGYELSLYAGNNQDVGQPIQGKASVITEDICT